MIAYLRGKLAAVGSDTVVIDVQGVGYRVNVTTSLPALLPRDEADIFIHTHMIVREDSIQLYGFLTPEEITVFTLLLSVNGVGPKVAMAVLSYLNPQGLGRALIQGDISTLTKVPGVGKKTAQRLILELKDKISKLELKSDQMAVQQDPGGAASVLEDAVAALLALGYVDKEARGAVQRAMESGTEDVGKTVQLALRLLDQTKR